jgi:hypothetical protein
MDITMPYLHEGILLPFAFLLRLSCFATLLPADLPILIPLSSYNSAILLQIPARFASSIEKK